MNIHPEVMLRWPFETLFSMTLLPQREVIDNTHSTMSRVRASV